MKELSDPDPGLSRENLRAQGRFQKALNWCLEHPARTFFICACLITLDHYILGPFSYLKWHDLGEVHFTRYLQISNTSDQFGQYYWYPYGAGGVDVLSNGFRFTDIHFFFFKIFPYWLVIPLLRLIQLFIAGWFTFLLCRDSVKLSTGAAMAGGLFYQFLQLNLMEYYFGLGAIPLLAWALERLFFRKGWLVWPSVFGLGLTYSFIATVHLSMVFSLPALFAWLWLIRGLAFWRLVSLMVVFGIACLLPQADMIWAMAENAPLSHRAQWNLGSAFFGNKSKSVLEFALNYYPLIVLNVIGAFLAWRKRDFRPLILLLLVTATVASIVFEVPIRRVLGTFSNTLRGFTLSRFAATAPYFLSIGAAWGLWYISQTVNRPRLVTGIYAVALGLVSLHPIGSLAGNVRDWVQWGNYASIFQSPEIKSLAREYKTSDEPFRVAVTQENGLQAGFVNAYGLETIGSYLNMYPNRYKIFWGLVTEPYLLRNPEAREYFTNFGGRLSLLTDDGHLLRISARDYFRMNLLSLANVKYFITTVPLESPSLELIEETRPDRFWDEHTRKEKIAIRLRENFSGRHVMVYRNKDVLPRWFLAGAEFVKNQKELGRNLASRPTKELARIALIEEKYAGDFVGIDQQVKSGNIKVLTYSPDVIRLNVIADQPSVLVVSNTYSPYWRALVNGKKAPLVPAYGVFWGIPIVKGNHKVELRYQPPYALFSQDKAIPSAARPAN